MPIIRACIECGFLFRTSEAIRFVRSSGLRYRRANLGSSPRDTAWAMSKENVELVRKALKAWNERDQATLAGLIHPEGEFLLPRNLLESGSYRGDDALRRALSDSAEDWDESTYEVEQVRDLDNRVLVLGWAVNIAKGGGPRVEYSLAWVFTVRDDKIAGAKPYLDRAEALEAAGLRE